LSSLFAPTAKMGDVSEQRGSCRIGRDYEHTEAFQLNVRSPAVILQARSIMAGSGPEDYYVLHPVKSTSTFATAGPDYVLRYTKPRAPLDFPDQDDHDRFRKVASDFRDGAGPADVLLKLDMDRSLCPQARLAHELCKATKYEHQKARACMATWQEFSRCQVKL
jgi:hypothetical protein